MLYFWRTIASITKCVPQRIARKIADPQYKTSRGIVDRTVAICCKCFRGDICLSATAAQSDATSVWVFQL
jgi:hypothetical protein